MGFLADQKILITGLLSNRSIAWGIAQAAHREGATLAFAYLGEGVRERVEGLVKDFPGSPVLPCDVTRDEEIEALSVQNCDYICGVTMFEKIFIANRGEIAIRIIRTCRKLNIKAVAVYSDIDARSLRVREADEAVHTGQSPSTSSYLVHEKIINAAVAQGCQAIHPGYGFLSENSAFAAAVVKAGLTYIGPPAEVIVALGDKISAKHIAIKAGVPVVVGHNMPVADIEEIRALAAGIGYPILLKPAAGGGGRGMRMVASSHELESALKSAQEETRKAFGDNRIFLERFVSSPRHIEIQIIADKHGNVISLGERE